MIVGLMIDVRINLINEDESISIMHKTIFTVNRLGIGTEIGSENKLCLEQVGNG